MNHTSPAPSAPVPVVLPPSALRAKRESARREREAKIAHEVQETVVRFNECIEKNKLVFTLDGDKLPVCEVYESHDPEFTRAVLAAFHNDGYDEGWTARFREREHGYEDDSDMRYHVEILDPDVTDPAKITQFMSKGE